MADIILYMKHKDDATELEKLPRIQSVTGIDGFLKQKKGFSIAYTASCRERICSYYSSTLGIITKAVPTYQWPNYDMQLVTKGNMVMEEEKLAYVRALFEDIPKPRKSSGLSSYYRSRNHYKSWIDTYPNSRGILGVYTNYFCDPWKISAVLYVLKYGGTALKTLPKRVRVDKGARKKYLGALLNTKTRDELNVYSLFGCYLLATKQYSLHHLNSIDNDSGVYSHMGRYMMKYMSYYYEFLEEYSDIILAKYRGVGNRSFRTLMSGFVALEEKRRAEKALANN